ncbi:MAG TPA: SagB/ThcOx family dehydrogenase [Dehalococcoidia bacterium]|nr:SagB/ThcOx family dehydrogenase [Dehalococcoidia bacterium]
MSVEETLEKRRSKRRFTPKELTWEQISQLLWAGQGMAGRRYRTTPSAGALYPLEVYLVIKEGVYHYKPESHELEQILEGDVRPELCRAALNQEWIEEAPVNIVIAAIYQRMERGYGQRAARYVHIEVGHAAQNIHLEAVSLGLGSVPIGAFYDEQVQRVLSLPKNEQPLYIIPVGYPAE